jgi:iron complex outermembrane receptor protein
MFDSSAFARSSIFLLGFALAGTAQLCAEAPIVLEKVTVVASPVVAETTIDNYGGATTVVGKDQLDTLNAQDLAGALRRTPGVSITRYNAVGAFGGGEGGMILVRGLGSSRPGGEIKLTVDGVPKYNAVFNHPLLDLMTLDLASSIEVSRRAAPLEVGNSFASINLVSPRATTPEPSGQLGLTYGSFSTTTETFAAGEKVGTIDAYVGQSYRASDGDRPDSGGKLTSQLAHVGWQPDKTWDLSYLVNHTDNQATDPGPLSATGLAQTRGDVYATRDWFHLVTAAHRTDLEEGWLKAYLNTGEGDWLRRFSSGNDDSLNGYRLSGLRARETLHLWPDGEIIAGADYDLSRGQSTTVPASAAPTSSFGPTEFRLASAYAGLSQNFDLGEGLRLTPSAGARYYDHAEFGSAWAPQIGIVLIDGKTKFHASYGRALNYPGLDVAVFSQIIIPPLGQSWKTLKPEQLDQFEAGVQHDFNETFSSELTLFRNQGRNRYVFETPPAFSFRYTSIGKFRTDGAEFTVTVKPSASLSLFGGASTLRTQPSNLPYSPKLSLVGGLTWQPLPALTINADGSYLSRQHASSQARAYGAANPATVGAYALFNLRVAHTLPWGKSRKSEVFVAGENLLNRTYYYQPGYPLPGASVTTGIKLGF